jgi:anthranilate phosphoribosyltransferase
MQFEPDQVGYEKAKVVEIQGGNPAENADIMRALFDGKKDAYRDVVVLNAAAGIMVGGKAKDFQEGVTLAEESIDSGAAKDVLQRLVDA